MERVAGAATRGADPLRGCDRGPVFGRGGGGGGGGGGGEAEEGCRCKSNRRARPRCREKQKTLSGGRFGVTAGRQWEGRCRRRGEEGLAGRGMFGRSSCRERRRTSHSLSLSCSHTLRPAGWLAGALLLGQTERVGVENVGCERVRLRSAENARQHPVETRLERRMSERWLVVDERADERSRTGRAKKIGNRKPPVGRAGARGGGEARVRCCSELFLCAAWPSVSGCLSGSSGGVTSADGDRGKASRSGQGCCWCTVLVLLYATLVLVRRHVPKVCTSTEYNRAGR